METQQLECTHWDNPLACVPPAPLTTPQDQAWLWQDVYRPVVAQILPQILRKQAA